VSHFSCIGLDVPDPASFGRVVAELAKVGDRSEGVLGTRLLWSDDSGAELAVFVRDEKIECVKPTFSTPLRTLVRPIRMIDDPRGGCAFCAIAEVEVLERGEFAYPLAIELDDIHLGPMPERDRPTEIALTAFAEHIEVWLDLASFKAADNRFAARSLIPSGLFAPDDVDRPPRAEAIITGVVTAAERKTNGYSGRSYDWCQIETYAMTLDVVAELQPEPFAAGQTVQGTFWLVGRRADAHRSRRFKRRRPKTRRAPTSAEGEQGLRRVPGPVAPGFEGRADPHEEEADHGERQPTGEPRDRRTEGVDGQCEQRKRAEH
jgi:hypothetical protein